MAEHNVVTIIILAITVPIVLSGVFIWLKYRYLKDNEDYQIFNKILGEPLLILFAIMISVPITSDYYEPEIIQLIYDVEQVLVFLLVIAQFLLYLRYIRDYYQSTDKVPTYVTALLLIGLLIFPMILLAGMGDDFAWVGLSLLSFILGIGLSIFIIAAGIGISPVILNFLHHRRLTEGYGLEEGSIIEIQSDPPISGEVTEIKRERIIIAGEDKEYYLTPSKIRDLGYSISKSKK